jgi:6-phosphogluconolactonase (cycloisomerase 2 family)
VNTVSSEGAAPAHLSIDATGKFVFVANYGGGSIAVFPILSGGSLGPRVDIHRDIGSLGGRHATNAPLGSSAISGHDAPHAHMIAADPANRFVLATDLAQDRVYVYGFDASNGKLMLANSVSLPNGDGPRHFAFHPNGHWLYTIQEEASTIAYFGYDGATGSVTARQTISALPVGFAGTNFCSEIVVSPDGRFLYAANRLHDTIAVFTVGGEGRLTYMEEVSTMGDYPRHCRIDPTGSFLYVCNQHSDCITAFGIDCGTGLLTFTGEYTGLGSPAILTFLV